ncbi:MAG TPA: SDR family NAD(P)-dependent oxidoreductase [Acetobacteraceae bacterium]|nr:SDR family NAD(P)-dependent oxidoreductase [Acetobacteraceae bacterium]
MARVFITGSSTGLGLMAAQLLVEMGHRVVVHGRNQARAETALAAVPGADAAVVGDLSNIREVRAVAEQVNGIGRCDAVIHNAGIGYRQSHRADTEDGLPQLFATNTLAPYVLTALIEKPKRLVYLSSGMHRSATLNLHDLIWAKRAWRGAEAYAESKLHDVLIAFAVARRWPNVLSNALEPGWVATRMGGPGAPDDLDEGHRTQVWLAVGEDPAALVTGQYLYHKQTRAPNPVSRREDAQDQLLEACHRLSGIALPV